MRGPERGWAYLLARTGVLVGAGVFLTMSALGASADNASEERPPQVREVQDASPERERQLQELIDAADDGGSPGGSARDRDDRDRDRDDRDRDDRDRDDRDRDDRAQDEQDE